MAACALACACAGAGAQEDGGAHAFAHTYAGAAASAVLPQGGAVILCFLFVCQTKTNFFRIFLIYYLIFECVIFYF